MDLRRIRTFVAVADHGTVSRASSVLGITQPALSRQIADLAGELGVDLFRRAGRRLALTSEGEQLLDSCRAVLACADALAERVRRFAQGDTGVLRVAAAPQTIENVLPTFLARYAKRYPDVQVKLVEAVAFDHLDLLERGAVQIAINVVREGDRRFAAHALPPLEVLAVSARPLRAIVDIRTLAQQPLLLPKSGFASRKLFDAACRLERIEPNVVVESDSPGTLVALAKARQGIALIPSTVLIEGKRLYVGRLACRGRLLQTGRAILWDRRRPLPDYAHGFCKMLAVHMRELFRPARRGRWRANRAAARAG
jgi:DNA-binding transcriptional LysR family regulator